MEIWQNPALPSLAPWSQSFRWHCELETSFFRIAVENRCQLNRSMQHSSILLIRLCFSKRPDPLGCTQLNLNRAVFFFESALSNEFSH